MLEDLKSRKSIEVKPHPFTSSSQTNMQFNASWTHLVRVRPNFTSFLEFGNIVQVSSALVFSHNFENTSKIDPYKKAWDYVQY